MITRKSRARDAPTLYGIRGERDDPLVLAADP